MNKNKKIWIGLGALTGLAVVVSSITIPLVVSRNKSDSDRKKNIADQEKEQNIADAVTTQMIESAIKAAHTWDASTEVDIYASKFSQIELHKGDINGLTTATAVVSLKNPNFRNGTIGFSATVIVGESGTKTITGKLKGFQSSPQTIDDLPPALKKFYLDAGYTKGSTIIESGLFNGQVLPDGFTIPASITSIGENAFLGATLPDGFTIPSSVTFIGHDSFKNTTLPVGFTIPLSVTSIGVGAFSYTTLPDGFTIPSSVISIYPAVFRNTTLPDGFTIPSSVTSIEYHAFLGATLPAGFTIPSSVKSIGPNAFVDVILPTGYHWSNRAPTAGSSVVKN